MAAWAPLLAVSSLRGFDGVDDITAKFLLQQALVMKEKEEERVKSEQEQLKRQEDQEEARLTRLQAERDAMLVLGLETLSSQQKKTSQRRFGRAGGDLGQVGEEESGCLGERSSRRFLLTPLGAALVVDSGNGSVALLVLLVTMYLAQGFWKIFTRRSSSWPSPYSAQCLVLTGYMPLVRCYVRVHSSSCGAHRDVVHNHRCHCYCRGFVLSSAGSLLRGCLRRDVVWWWIFLSWWCFRFYLGQCEADGWKIPLLLFPVLSVRWVYLHAEFLVQQLRRNLPRQLIPVPVEGQVSQYEVGVVSVRCHVTIKVDRDRVEVLPRGVPPPRFSPNLATCHTPSMGLPAFWVWHGNEHACGSSSLEWESSAGRVHGSSCGTCRRCPSQSLWQEASSLLLQLSCPRALRRQTALTLRLLCAARVLLSPVV